MFTGLIEEVGRVVRVRTSRGNHLLEIGGTIAKDLATGDSVAVNGCCLTVKEKGKRSFTVEATGTTLNQTNLGELRSGSRVNLERALVVGDRLGGHFVQGHIDEVGVIKRVEHVSGYWKIIISMSPANSRFLVEHGSVCVEGVSLTVALLRSNEFEVNIIPHTRENTVFKDIRAGARVNIEYDLIVKAIQRVRNG